MIPAAFETLADRYRIKAEVGTGGMATVYLADDVRHRRQVAIKVLKPEIAAVVGRERFLREIEIAARLNHPHIVPLFDSGAAGDLALLRHALRRGRVAPGAAAARVAAAG